MRIQLFLRNTVLALLLSSTAEASDLKKNDILSWPRANAAEFGCFLDREFEHKDPHFNCELKNYKHKGDPCKNTKAYYEGPEFPATNVKDVDPSIANIFLEWEHGVTFEPRVLHIPCLNAFKAGLDWARAWTAQCEYAGCAEFI